MSVFNTERPNYDLKHQQMLELAQVRKRNLAALKEQYNSNQNKSSLTAALESIDNESSKAKKNSDTEYKLTKLAESVKERNTTYAMGRLEERLVTEGSEKCLENVIFSIAYNGYWADDTIKEGTTQQMLECYRDTVGVLEKLNIQKKQDSPLMTHIKEACCNTAKKASERIVTEAKCKEDDVFCEFDEDDVDSINFSLTNDEEIELDDNLSSLGMDDISSLIKNKVLTVINDEQEASVKKDELFKEIDDSINELENELNSVADDLDDAANTDDDDDTEDSVSESVKFITRAKNNRIAKFTGTSLFECIMIGAIKNVKNDIVTENISATQTETMDAAFMESVLTYTILETFNVLKMYEFNASTVKSLKEYYKNR